MTKSSQKLFWIGSGVAVTGANIALAASLLNLFRLSQTAQPILLMMVIEAVVPLLVMKPVLKIFETVKTQNIFTLAAIIGAFGAIIQGVWHSSLTHQIIGIVFTALSASIQKPLMMQIAVRLSDDPAERSHANNLVTFINYLGVLVGYISSGFIITYLGYRACFFVNAISFMVFALIAFNTRFQKSKGSVEEEVSESAVAATVQNDHFTIAWIFILSVAMWITGGSINVLEVPFAQQVMGANELMTTVLFFVAALGAILFSTMLKKMRFPLSVLTLAWVSVVPAVCILFYVWIAHFYFILPFLVGYGFTAAAHGYLGMSLIQSASNKESLSKHSVYLNTTIQVVTLGAAGAAVLAAEYFGAQKTCIIFAVITIAVGLLGVLSSRKRNFSKVSNV